MTAGQLGAGASGQQQTAQPAITPGTTFSTPLKDVHRGMNDVHTELDKSTPEGRSGLNAIQPPCWSLWEVQTRIIELLAPTPGARACHLAVARDLVMFGQQGRGIRPSVTTIAFRIGLTDRVVRSAIHDLVAWGLFRETARVDGSPVEYEVSDLLRQLPGSLRVALKCRETIADEHAHRYTKKERLRRREARAVKATAFLPEKARRYDDDDEGDRFRYEITLKDIGLARRILDEGRTDLVFDEERRSPAPQTPIIEIRASFAVDDMVNEEARVSR